MWQPRVPSDEPWQLHRRPALHAQVAVERLPVNLLIGSAICLTLAFVIVALHDETLQFLTDRFLPRIPHPRRWHVGATALILLTAHVVEILVFAIAIFVVQWLGRGGLSGQVDDTAMSVLYFSFSCYTSLGTGDIYPVGLLRLVAGMESLIGLLMIGWSASFLLLEMREFHSIERRHSAPR